MYYLIKGKIEDDLGCGTFEWVVEAATQEEALAKLEEGEQVESIREISVEERIEIKSFNWKKHFDGKEYSMDGALEDFIELNKD